MNTSRSVIAVVAFILVGLAAYFAYQDFSNRNQVVDAIVTPLHEEKQAFEYSDPTPEETRQFPLEVLAIKPRGENVEEVSQITITFNKPMVSIGDFEKLAQDLEIRVTPDVDCQWRWLNRSSLACQLNGPLPSSNRYEIEIKSVSAFDGTKLQSSVKSTFSTEQWRVVQKQIDWEGPDKPVLLWTFNQPMDNSSVGRSLKSNCGSLTTTLATQNAAEEKGVDPKRSYVLRFTKGIGLAKNCHIELAKTAKSASGPEPGHAEVDRFTTYGEFKIERVDCQYSVNAKTPVGNRFIVTGCDPDYRASITFTAPVYARDLVGQIEVNPFFGWTKGGEGSPEYYKQNGDELYSQVTLKGPLHGRSTHTITLGNIKDQFGRPLKGAKIAEIQTNDFSPLLTFADSGFGVIEKDGPRQLAYDAVNIERFELHHRHGRSAAELSLWRYAQCRHNNLQTDSEFAFVTSPIEPKAPLNTPVTKPIDLKTLVPKFDHGLFFGSIRNVQVDRRVEVNSEFEDSCKNVLLVVTDLGILSKIGFYDSGVWIHSISTGRPLGNVRVQLRGYDQVLSEGVTDGRGFVQLSGSHKWDPEGEIFRTWDRDDDLFIVAETDDDFSILPFEHGTRGLSPYEFSNYDSGRYVSGMNLTASSNNLVHAITDRPLYQPGQKVQVKLFARHWEPRTYGLQPNKEITVEVNDSRGKEVYKNALKLSPYGTAHFEIDLDKSVPLGTFWINGRIGDKWTRSIGEFEVQEFTLPPFKVAVTPVKTRFLTGGSADFRTTAQYHFGGALARASGEYSVSFQERQWQPSLPQWQSYRFDDPVSLHLVGYEKPRTHRHINMEDGQLKTDKNGDSYKRILLSPNQIRAYGTLTFEAKFQDDRGKTIAGRTDAEVFYSDFQLGLKKEKWAYEAGEEIKPEVVLVDVNEAPVEGQEIKFKLVHRTYQTVRTRGAGNYFGYETRTKDKLVDECAVKARTGGASCSLKSKAAGSHFIVADAKDSKGRIAQSSLDVFVTGSEYVGWYRENHDRIEIIPDKDKYEVGDEISLLVKNPYREADALFTLERFGILKQFRQKLGGGAEIVKIPIDSKDYAPGFFVSVHIVKGRVSDRVEAGVDLGKPSFKMGLAEIKVVNPDTLLNVSTQTDMPEYEPRQEVTAEFEVRSLTGGKPSEISVAVVDEKILQLAGDYKDKFDLHSKFYNLPGLDVATSQLLSYLIGRRHFGQKGAPEGGDGMMIKAQARQNFLPIAYWNPALETNSAGKAKVKFSLPDNLTTWRILIVAVDKEHRFGFGSRTFRSTKKLMIEPALPSFLTEGDLLQARFGVHNRTGRDGDIQGRLDVQGVELKRSSDLQVRALNGDRALFEWPVSAPNEKSSAKFTVVAQHRETKDEDSAIYELPIRPFVSYETFAHYGSSTNASTTLPVQLPKDIRRELGGIEVSFSSSLISQLDDVFRYAFWYPYSCWEQKLVRALMLNSYSGLKSYVTLPELERDPLTWIQEIMGEMGSFQASNGGMGYWKSDLRTVDPYLSVFTALGLTWLNESKRALPKSPAEKVFQYTRDLASGTVKFPTGYSPKTKATVLAMAAYVQARLGDDVVSQVNRLHQEKALLSLFGKSFLWLAAGRSPATKAVSEDLKKEIFNQADLTSGEIQFQEAHDDGFKKILHSTTRSNCSLLISLLQDDAKSPFVEPLVRWIIGTRKANRWSNTQENIFCLNALANYAQIYEKETPDFTVEGTIANQKISPAQFKGFNQVSSLQKFSFQDLTADESAATDTTVRVSKAGPGRVYYTARMKVAYNKIREDAVNSGLQVKRRYFRKGSSGRWVPFAVSENHRIKRGDLVKVELKVSAPAARLHVALADSLPAGLEPLNTALAATSQSDARSGESDDSAGSYNWNEDDYWWGLYSSGGFYHKEIRLFGAQFFADHLPRGDYTLEYVAQAVETGEFNVAPAVAEQMYEPEVYGKSQPAKFIVTEN